MLKRRNIGAYLPKTVRFSVILTGGLENFNPHLGGFSKLGIPYLIATGGCNFSGFSLPGGKSALEDKTGTHLSYWVTNKNCLELVFLEEYLLGRAIIFEF